jgi:hypothetical protein
MLGKMCRRLWELSAGLGIIILLARPFVRGAFVWTSSCGSRVPTIWIRLIAMADFAAAPFEIAAMLSSKPQPLFGFAITGVPLILYRVGFAVFLVYVGRGLYRLAYSARSLAIACCVYSVAENVVWSLVTPTPHGGFSLMRAAGCTTGAALSGLIVWYLNSQRQLFANSHAVSIVD